MFARLDRLEADAARTWALLDRLETAILAKAFRGELVPQDPNDEPASVLLSRIRTQGEVRAKEPRKPTRTAAREKAMTKQSPRDRVLKDSERWPKAGLSFAEIAKRVSLPHDDMRDALFALMRGPKPTLRQQFDKAREIMRIQRIAA